MGAQAKIIIVMLIFGSLGLFVKNINLSSSEIALLRGAIGSVFLICASLLVKQRPSLQALKANLLLLVLSGAAIGFNWIFLFEAYRYTTISNATISYYFAPVFVMALAPFILKEKVTPIRIASIFAAMLGLFLMVNNGEATLDESYNHLVGIFYGLLAAALYASVILMNKFIVNLSDFETTLIQLMLATIVLAPYVFINSNIELATFTQQSIILILILGIVHTGFAYYLYFGAIKQLKGQTIAILSYIDPISAVIMSVLFLQESISFIQLIGGVLILGSTYFGGRTKKQGKKAID